MAEAQNFVEKEMEKIIQETTPIGPIAEPKPTASEVLPTYTPPEKVVSTPIGQDVANSTQTIMQEPEPKIQIIEKIVYKRQRIHGFFRTLTIIALLAIGFLMLGESTGLITLSVDSFKLHQVFPLFIIFSSIIIWSYKGIFGKIFGLILFMAVFGGIFTIGIYTSLNPSNKRAAGNEIKYTLPQASKTGETQLYISTLIGNSTIKGNTTTGGEVIQGTWQSDRNLLVSSGENQTARYLKFTEDSNRNVLQNYLSKADISIPKKTTIDLLYIKNLLGIHTIDLHTFQRKSLTFHAGINDISIDIGNVLSGNSIEIQGAAANISLTIPKDVGVILYYKQLIGAIKITGFDASSGHYFQSQNFATAKSILNLHINVGLGNTHITREE